MRTGRIYIDRSYATGRHLPNEVALAARLQQRGFHAVRPEELSLVDEI